MNPAPNLVLVGPMGAGKTSIGRHLAARLGLQFVDADQHLESTAGVTIPMLFELEGEPAFRAREAKVLAELMRGTGQVVSTGGGAVLNPDSRDALKRRGFVVYLQVSVAQQLQRLARDSGRPLLQGGDREAKLRALALVRNPLYEQVADLVFASTSVSASAAARKLGTLVQAQWRREEAA